MSLPSTDGLMTMGQVARHFGVQIVYVRRVIERGFVGQEFVPTIGRWRFTTAEHLPKFQEALIKAGYMKRRKPTPAARLARATQPVTSQPQPVASEPQPASGT